MDRCDGLEGMRGLDKGSTRGEAVSDLREGSQRVISLISHFRREPPVGRNDSPGDDSEIKPG